MTSSEMAGGRSVLEAPFLLMRLFNYLFKKGKNLQGLIGLFPRSYTASAPAPTLAVTSVQNDSPQEGKLLLHPLDGEPEPESAAHGPEQGHSSATIYAPIPKTPAVIQQNGNSNHSSSKPDSSTISTTMAQDRSGSDGEVMKATLTDVQQAIEQLGRHDHEAAEDRDGERSFSFSSSRDDDGEIETDTDYENSDADVASAEMGAGQSWHTSTRNKLAETARRAVEEAKKLEAISNANTISDRWTTVPPIDVELSDESDGEEYTHHSSSFKRTHPHIPEEDEGEEKGDPESAHASVDNANTNGNENNLSSNINNDKDSAVVHDSPVYVTAQSSTSQSITTAASATPSATLETRTIFSSHSEEAEKVKTNRLSSGSNPFSPLNTSKRSSVTEAKVSEPRRASLPRSIGNVVVNSLDRVVRAVSPQPQTQGQEEYFSTNLGVEQERDKERGEKREMPPTEWSVEDVIEWLKSKGFDQDVQNKFIGAFLCPFCERCFLMSCSWLEQEITGDVLLELDANLLKSEIGIMAFGKRVRIANAIVELRGFLSSRSSPLHGQHGLPSGQVSPPDMSFPGSISYQSSSVPSHVLQGASSHSPLTNHFMHGHPHTSGGHSTYGHERTYSTSQNSQRSIPGSVSMPVSGGMQMLYSQSLPGGTGGAGMHQSVSMPLPSPVGTHGPGYWGAPGSGTNGVNGQGTGTGMESAAGSLASRDEKERGKVGLGLVANDEKEKRPANLLLSPSDGALSDTIKVVNVGDGEEDEEEDRGHMSETDATVVKKTRRRLFGRSHDSAVSHTHTRNSKDVSVSGASSTQGSPAAKDSLLDKDKDIKAHVRPKRSMDMGKMGSDRLSIFGATFSGSLGKGRKPPPRYSLDDNSERSSLFPLPRLASTVGRKSSGRPQTPNGSPKLFKQAEKEKDRETVVLRKRPASSSGYIPPGMAPTSVAEKDGSPVNGTNGEAVPLKQGQSIMEQIGEPDHSGWMRKRGERYNTWRTRYFLLSGPHLYCLKNNSTAETKIKGYVNIMGYKVTVDETVDPGKYGFRIDHDTEKTHYFSSDDKTVVRDWMKAIMKATIGRDYSKPVISSCNIPTIPLTVAQAMNPAPRPPSPSARAATQKAHRSKDLESLGVRDLNEVPDHATLVLMGLQPQNDSSEEARADTLSSKTDKDEGKGKEDDWGSITTPKAAKSFSAPPPRPAREAKRQSTRGISGQLDAIMIEWANSHLPAHLRVTNPFEQTYSALALFRLTESIKGHPASPPVPDSAFPSHPNDDKSIEGLFALFDFLVNNEVKMGSVSINDVRLQRPDKVAQIVKALKSWEDRRRFWGHGGLV
ncbi:hypothetical protein AX15_001885 [Amanita polypyramis BW_CC]|nr:hypothetical protein AX15_001885 [Amanita polypyramis BW_CC]